MYPTLSLFIIDGIGPFFQENRREEINWSKIDFSDLDSGGGLPEDRIRRIEEGFRVFTRRAAAMGYNAVTLDDLAHLVSHSFYPEALQKKIAQYQDLYRSLFAIAAKAGLQVFITTDLLFFNEAIEQTVGNHPQKLRGFTADCCRILFDSFPDAEGIIFRIGESDGVDVEGDFRSRLLLKTAQDARRMLQTLHLPRLCTEPGHGRQLPLQMILYPAVKIRTEFTLLSFPSGRNPLLQHFPGRNRAGGIG